MSSNKKISYILLALPLLIYPFILLANVMSTAGFPGKTTVVKLVVVKGFLWLSTLYPISYIIALLPWVRGKKYGVLLPLVHLLLTILFFIAWMYLG
jgi:hypothetical protein